MTTVIGTLSIAFIATLSYRYQRAQIWDGEFEKLRAIAADELQRNERSSDQVRAAIRALERQQAPPCSPQSLALMAQLNLEYGQLQGVGYVANGRLVCSSYGRHDGGIPLSAAYYHGNSGGLILRREVDLSLDGNRQSRHMIVVTADASGYSAIVSPALALDVYTKDPDVAFGTVLSSSDHVRIARGGFDPVWRARLGNASRADFVERDRIVALQRSSRYDYFAFAAVPAVGATGRIRQAGLLIGSCAAFAMAMLVFVVLRLARQEVPMSESIRDAIRRREFYLVYQPVVDLKTGEWVGAEALLRWRTHTGELVRPDVFISIAEGSGLMEEVTDHVLELAAADLGGFFRKFPNFHIAINLSSSEMQSPDVVSRLKNFVSRVAGASGHNFVFEATERSLLDPEKARAILMDLRGLGSSVAIDDFGTGYSSLSYLQTLSADYLKIDKSFIDAIDTLSVTNHVVEHIIGLARDLQLRMVAEGVETAEQADYLRERGVEYAQGWHFARPMEFDELCRSLGRQG
jgi:sensor c-di-GMP phosphodiesterase-like protein